MPALDVSAKAVERVSPDFTPCWRLRRGELWRLPGGLANDRLPRLLAARKSKRQCGFSLERLPTDRDGCDPAPARLHVPAAPPEQAPDESYTPGAASFGLVVLQ